MSATADINFTLNEDRSLSVLIETEHLRMRSVAKNDYDHYAALFGDAEVMQYIGPPQTREETIARVDGWINRWREGNPYSGFAIFKKGMEEFVGHVVLERGDLQGEAELTVIENKRFWHLGYGNEVVTAIIHNYAPATINKAYPLDSDFLKKIVATVRSSNVAGVRIIEKVGMRYIHSEEQSGIMRCHYALNFNGAQMQASKKANGCWCTLL